MQRPHCELQVWPLCTALPTSGRGLACCPLPMWPPAHARGCQELLTPTWCLQITEFNNRHSLKGKHFKEPPAHPGAYTGSAMEAERRHVGK